MNMKKRILSTLLVLCMAVLLLPVSALAYTEETLNGTYFKTKYDSVGDNETSWTFPAGTQYIYIKQATNGVMWTSTDISSDNTLKSALSADISADSGNKGIAQWISGYNAFDLSSLGKQWCTYTFTQSGNGSITVTANKEGKVSHFDFGPVTNSGTTTPEPDPTPDLEPDPTPTPSDKESEPSLDKDISSDGENYEETTLNAVKPGDTVYFRLESQLPSDIGTDDDGNATEGQTLTFTDTMTDNLDLDTSSIAVKIGDTTVTDTYYTVGGVATNDDGTKTFTVTLKLTELYNDNSDNAIEESAFNDETGVSVTYHANVSADVNNGDTFQNNAYVTYHEQSETSVVTGTVENDPKTGGMGTTLFTLTGLGLMAAGVLILYRRKEQTV